MAPRAALLPAALLLAGASAAPDPIEATITYLVGRAEIRRGGKVLPARVSVVCRAGDTLATDPASRLELRFADNSLLRLDEGTRLVLTPRVDGKPEPALLVGRVWANVVRKLRGGGFGVRAPTAVAAVRGTVFGVQGSDSASSVRLYEGKVDVGSTTTDSLSRVRPETNGPREVSLEDWVHLLRGEAVTFRRDGTWSRAAIDFAIDLKDPWTRFNADRDSAAGRPWSAKTDSDNPWAK